MSEDIELPHSDPRANTLAFLTKTRFTAFDISPEIHKGLHDLGFTHCSPIQAQVLPIALEGRDVAGQAQTGTGKTAAFLIPIIARLLSTKKKRAPLPSALIVAPTRELAIQIFQDATCIGHYTGLTFLQVVGGIDYKKQADQLIEGADVVIGTPGRIIDYMKQGILKPKGIQMLVIDEADRLFDLGFTKDMRYILRKLPHYEKRQSMLFSATLSYRVLALTYDYMNLPEIISVAPEEITVDGIDQSLYHVGKKEKFSLLLGILQKEDWDRVLIFSNTRSGVEQLAHRLKGNDWPAEGITGDLPQRKRLKLMERFKKGDTKILVATDVASRGIHVEDISHVINFDLPQDPENYIHRIGRTARAGKTGKAISLACEEYVFHLEPVEKMIDNKIPVMWAEEDWFLADRSKPLRSRRRRPSLALAKRGSSGTHRKKRISTHSKRSSSPQKSKSRGHHRHKRGGHKAKPSSQSRKEA
jgi:ATP-dependent RNA helicase RhlB